MTKIFYFLTLLFIVLTLTSEVYSHDYNVEAVKAVSNTNYMITCSYNTIIDKKFFLSKSELNNIQNGMYYLDEPDWNFSFGKLFYQVIIIFIFAAMYYYLDYRYVILIMVIYYMPNSFIHDLENKIYDACDMECPRYAFNIEHVSNVYNSDDLLIHGSRTYTTLNVKHVFRTSLTNKDNNDIYLEHKFIDKTENIKFRIKPEEVNEIGSKLVVYSCNHIDFSLNVIYGNYMSTLLILAIIITLGIIALSDYVVKHIRH